MADLVLPDFTAAGAAYFDSYFTGKLPLSYAEQLDPSALVGRMKALLGLAKANPAVRAAFNGKGVFYRALFARDMPVDQTPGTNAYQIKDRVPGADAVTVAMLDALRKDDALAEYVGGDVFSSTAVAFALEKRPANVVVALLRLLQEGAIPEAWWSTGVIEGGLDKLAAVLPDRRYTDPTVIPSINKGLLEVRSRLSLLRADKAAKALTVGPDGKVQTTAKKKPASLLESNPVAVGLAAGLLGLLAFGNLRR